MNFVVLRRVAVWLLVLLMLLPSASIAADDRDALFEEALQICSPLPSRARQAVPMACIPATAPVRPA